MSTTASTPPAPADEAAGGQPAVPAWVPLAAVAVTLLLWASAFVGIRYLVDDFTPGALSLGRLAVGSAALALMVLLRRTRPGERRWPRPTRRQWLSLLTIGVLWFGVYNLALNAGEREIDAGTAAMLIQVAPVLIALLAAIFLRERFTPLLAVGLLLAFGGVALISLADHDGADAGNALLGVVLCLVSAVVYSVSVIIQKPLMARIPALHVTWLACTIGAVTCLPFAGQLLDEVAAAPVSSTLWLVYLGVFPTAIAFTTYAVALSHMSASQLGITTYLVPPITIVLGVLLLGEAPPALAYVGGVLALVGVGVARRKPRPRQAGSAASR